MKEIIRVERKRILNMQSYLIISAVALLLSIFSTADSLKNYNIYDSSGNVTISSKENIKESKQEKYNTLLDENTLKDIVNRKDKSKYLYNSNLVRLVSSNYQDQKVEELTSSDIGNFYNQRNTNVKNNLKVLSSAGLAKFTDKQIKDLVEKTKKLDTPLKVGYAEGWKNLNNDMIDIMPLILGLISVIILPVFAEDPKTKMRQLYISTEHGKKTLVKSRIVAGFEIGAINYFTIVLIFTLCKLLIFGFQGASLPIQSSTTYFLSVYNITYFEQYLLNIVLGFVAMLFTVSMTLLFTTIVDQILSGAVLLVFSWIIMIMLPDMFVIKHYFSNFLPYGITNFNNYYINNEVYSILNHTVPSITLVAIVSILISIIFTAITLIISNSKLKLKLK